MVGNLTFPKEIVLIASGIEIPETGNYCEIISQIKVCSNLCIASVQSVAFATIKNGGRVDETSANTEILC